VTETTSVRGRREREHCNKLTREGEVSQKWASKEAKHLNCPLYKKDERLSVILARTTLLERERGRERERERILQNKWQDQEFNHCKQNNWTKDTKNLLKSLKNKQDSEVSLSQYLGENKLRGIKNST
jgi:hypothetical protein